MGGPPAKGCTNKDVLTKLGILSAFSSGKAAMLVDGSWDTATLQKGLGKNLAPFAPPYSDSKQGGVDSVPGRRVLRDEGLEAPQGGRQFLKFMMTPEGREDHLRRRAHP